MSLRISCENIMDIAFKKNIIKPIFFFPFNQNFKVSNIAIKFESYK